MALRVLVGPLADSVKHVSLDFDILVTKGGVVEGAKNVVNNFVNRNTGVLPGVENPAGNVSEE